MRASIRPCFYHWNSLRAVLIRAWLISLSWYWPLADILLISDIVLIFLKEHKCRKKCLNGATNPSAPFGEHVAERTAVQQIGWKYLMSKTLFLRGLEVTISAVKSLKEDLFPPLNSVSVSKIYYQSGSGLNMSLYQHVTSCKSLSLNCAILPSLSGY